MKVKVLGLAVAQRDMAKIVLRTLADLSASSNLGVSKTSNSLLPRVRVQCSLIES